MDYSICVGVDGSAPSLKALRFALDEAVLRGCEVHVLTTWWPSNSLPGTVEAESAIHQEQAERVQDVSLSHVLEEYANPPTIRRTVVRGEATEALVHHSRADNQLVVGSHHKGVLKRILEGSVSAYCTRNSQIPVTVVPHVDAALVELHQPGA